MTARLYVAPHPYIEKVIGQAQYARVALNRISIGIVGRGNTGRLTARSAVAAAAYEAREALFDEQRGRVHDYTADRADLVHDEILLPKLAPYRWFDREVLWNEVEARERRSDAQVARSVILTLPRELDTQAGTDLAREYFQDAFVRRGMVVDMAVHTKDASDGEPQPHAHALLTMRRIVDGAFGLKETAWNKVSAIKEWREEWAEMANRRLAEHGISARLDHRPIRSAVRTAARVAGRATERVAEVATLARAAAIIGAAVVTHAAREAVRRVVPRRRERKQQDMPTNKLAADAD
jgi:ATP-dependent exoDNAse (exonuclease V) alpha subunit